MQQLKALVRRHPRLYDLLNQRRPLKSATERWVDAFSRACSHPPTFIQVGANDGLMWDPFRRFIVRDAWSGVLVEPVPGTFQILRRNYRYLPGGRLRFVNALVAQSERGHLPLWVVSEAHLEELDEAGQLFWLRKSSLSRQHILSHVIRSGLTESLVVPIQIPTTSLTKLVTEELGGRTPDIIVSDAEGFDDSVIFSLDLDQHRPRAILFEAHSLGDRLEGLTEHLEQCGYSLLLLEGDAVATPT